MNMPDLDLAAAIPPQLSEADDLLTRYGRWATSGRSGAARCGSAEGHYRAESWQAVERRRAPLTIGMRLQEALTCQRALARVPEQERIVLTILYVPQRLPPEVQLRLLRIPPRLSQERHLRGLRMFDNLFAMATMRAT